MTPDTTALENSDVAYLRFAHQTVDTFLVAHGRLPSLDFVMAHLRHTSILFAHAGATGGSYVTVAKDLRTSYPSLS
jgi:hypothetical protein